ncbi:MAG: hypothetical protein GY778_27000 [bacterium]|nr:hypothetical protein [bacterium]
MVELEERYAEKPVHFFHVIPGENAVQALDFKKHYRSDAVFLMDPTYATSKTYQGMSWPTDLIVDPEGQIVGSWIGLSKTQDRAAAVKLLDELAAKARGGPPRGTYCVGNKCYVRTEQDVFEMQPTMVADRAGQLHLVFVRDRGGVGDLYHHRLDGGTWSEPKRITRSAADDYAPALCADPAGGVRLVWCSNRSPSGRYDIFANRLQDTTWSAPERITETDDDAAHPRAVVDKQGNFWITYYRWMPWNSGQSRDREIFARYHDGQAWSKEIQLSPTDVPIYEDHADPSIAADAAGNVWVAWAWDTHPEQGKWPYAPTFGSAVFTRQLRAGQPPSQLQMVAMRSPSIRAAKRNGVWAFLPEVACRSDQPWFAFETHTVGGAHACGLTTYQPGRGFAAPTEVGQSDTFICSPKFVVDRNDGLYALWSAPAEDRYAVYLAALDADGNWGAPQKVWSEADADLRHPVAAFDGDDRLWLAAVRIRPGSSQVARKSIDLAEPKR